MYEAERGQLFPRSFRAVVKDFLLKAFAIYQSSTFLKYWKFKKNLAMAGTREGI